jgi:hypothetical protein
VYFQREPLVVRLSKLADSGQTGVLRLPGEHGGAIHLSEGDVVYAESKRTPGPARWFAHLPDLPDGSAPAAAEGEAGGLAWSFAVREATIDAALELLSSRPRYALRQRFRESGPPVVDGAGGMPFAELLTEVGRRQELVRQMASAATPLTADTPVVRNPDLHAPRLQVSALQWALLIRVNRQATPRELAWEIGNSVFGTTLEVFRLISLGFLTAAQAPDPKSLRYLSPVDPAADPDPQPGRAMVSFLRAVTR